MNPCPPPLSAEIQLRFSDLDAYGHVNNSVFFTYLETARTQLFLDRFLDLSEQGLLLLVVRAECNYHKPINLADRVLVDMNISHVGNSSFDIDYAVHDGKGKNFATARTVMVCFDPQQGKSVQVPARFLATATPVDPLRPPA